MIAQCPIVRGNCPINNFLIFCPKQCPFWGKKCQFFCTGGLTVKNCAQFAVTHKEKYFLAKFSAWLCQLPNYALFAHCPNFWGIYSDPILPNCFCLGPEKMPVPLGVSRSPTLFRPDCAQFTHFFSQIFEGSTVKIGQVFGMDGSNLTRAIIPSNFLLIFQSFPTRTRRFAQFFQWNKNDAKRAEEKSKELLFFRTFLSDFFFGLFSDLFEKSLELFFAKTTKVVEKCPKKCPTNVRKNVRKKQPAKKWQKGRPKSKVRKKSAKVKQSNFEA